jgi:FkbM family methyltransferase
MDVGAFRGSFTDAALLYWQPARVWLIEAQPDCAAALRAKYASNPVCRVVHSAVAAANGQVELRINESPDSSSILPILPESTALYGKPLGETRRLLVPGKTLDTLFAAEGIESVDLMKVDIQGAEKQLIEGGRNALQRVHQLYIEVVFDVQYAGSAVFSEVEELLRELGFKVRGFSQGRLGADGALAYTDALFIRPQIPAPSARGS